MPTSTSLQDLIQLYSKPIKDRLTKAHYTPPESTPEISIKSRIQSLIEPQTSIQNLALCIAALASASNSTTQHLSWVPDTLSVSAVSAFKEFAEVYYKDEVHVRCSRKVELDLSGVEESWKKLVIELMPEVLILLKGIVKESAIDASDENDNVLAKSAGVPAAYAILAANQFRWFVIQVDGPYLGKICSWVIPCALTALDHWSPEVKEQGMISFIHLAKRVSASDIGGYADVVLDACCQNVATDDSLWHYAVEMSVLLVTLTQQSNPRSSWYEKLLNEMLNHLERQPRNKERRVAWLKHIDLLFNGIGLILLANFRTIFPLFYKWMHADDDETVLLVLERIVTVLRLTWIRNSPFIDRLIDELVILYKDAALKVAREDIRSLILQILILIRQSKGLQFQAIWTKYEGDPNLRTLQQLLSERDLTRVMMLLDDAGVLAKILSEENRAIFQFTMARHKWCSTTEASKWTIHQSSFNDDPSRKKRVEQYKSSLLYSY